MTSLPTLSIIIPCYNESDRVSVMFEGLKKFTAQYPTSFEIIIVDDGSNDGTDILIIQNPYFKELSKENKIILLQQNNKGKGGALQLGVANASKEFILTLDADMATIPDEIFNWNHLKKSFQSNEILIGSRELKDSKVNDSFKRKLIGNIFNLIIKIITKLNITDTQCGFKLYPAEVAKTIFKDLKTLGWAHDVEVLLRAKKMNINIVEMPITWNAMAGSKINVLKDSWKMFWEVVSLRKLT